MIRDSLRAEPWSHAVAEVLRRVFRKVIDDDGVMAIAWPFEKMTRFLAMI